MKTDIKKLQEKLEEIRSINHTMITPRDLKEVCELILGESLDKPKPQWKAGDIIRYANGEYRLIVNNRTDGNCLCVCDKDFNLICSYSDYNAMCRDLTFYGAELIEHTSLTDFIQ